jgi:hypothetical protein
MGIYRSNNPADFDDIDGIIVDESAPPSSIQGAQTNVCILVGQFASGPVAELTDVGSIGELHEIFSKSSSYKGNIALKNKKFGTLKVIRAAAAAAAKATLTCDDGGGTPVDIIKFDAKYKGAYGNSITVTIAAGSTEGSKYTITDSRSTAVIATEVYDNVVIDEVGDTFANSKLVDVTVLATSDEPATQSATALASGADGTIADSDYQTAIAAAEVEGAGNVLFLDEYSTTRNGYLKTHAAATQDKMCILSHAEADSAATIATAAASQRDTEGRLIYAANWIQTTIDGVATYTSPASWLASIISQIHPSVDPAFAKNVQYMAGATGVKTNYTRSQHITLKDAGVCAFENDADLGIKPKAGVVTQIADTSKRTILRRRMADFLSVSCARFLKNYQNAVNSKSNRDSVKAALLAFIQQQENLGVLPKDSELSTGKAKSVDTESANTDLSVGQGYFYVLWKQRIYSSMRFIVLQAQIGETVVVSEQ